VQAHANRDRQRVTGRRGGGECPGRGRKCDEERVALRVDLDAAVLGGGIADDAAMRSERLRVSLGPELVQQPRRPLDVGEEERHGARWEIRSHACSI
jgi:hypothetical protein